MKEKPPLIIIAGPTATGKTKLAVQLAKEIGGEIISADSMQIYKYMDIGTAKPTKEEMDGIPHYLIDELYPDEEYSVALFQKMALKALEIIYSKGKTPILTGGTGFYINGLLYGTDFSSCGKDPDYCDELIRIAAEKGNLYLHSMLKQADPVSAETIHPNNVKRVIRALEYFHLTGEAISLHNQREKQRASAYNEAFYILNMDRERLYERIDLRVDKMMDMGLVEEVGWLLEKGYGPELISMQGLGYKEIVGFLQGEYSLAAAVEILKRDTRHFAKRQLTWFKGQTQGCWIKVDEMKNRNIMKLLKDAKIKMLR